MYAYFNGKLTHCKKETVQRPLNICSEFKQIAQNAQLSAQVAKM
jgi:hypothetical protein